MLEFAPIPRRESLPEAIARQLRAAIFQGRFQAGQSLPSEASLAETFGTNRTTMREAMRLLHAERLVEIEQGKVAKVLDFRRTSTLHILPALIEAMPPEGDLLRLIKGLLAIRRTFLVYLLPEVINQATDEDISSLTLEALRLQQLRWAPTIEISRQDALVYRALVDCAHNLIYHLMFNTFMQAFEPLVERAAPLVRFPDIFFHSHSSFVKAIQRRNIPLAQESLDTHLSNIDGAIIGMLV